MGKLQYLQLVLPRHYIVGHLAQSPFFFWPLLQYHQNNLMEQLHNVMPDDNSNGPIYSLYDDLAYPQSSYLLGGFRNVINGMDEANFNRLTSSIRITVEWGYFEIIEQWKFLDFCQAMRIFLSPVVQYYINAAFFCNLRICMIGNKTRNYFDAHQMTIEEYLALVTQS